MRLTYVNLPLLEPLQIKYKYTNFYRNLLKYSITG